MGVKMLLLLYTFTFNVFCNRVYSNNITNGVIIGLHLLLQ